ncbi:MAG TPA: PD-(D/E)XK nuclease family protein [Clostridiales bacterium]|nr:PD-(D/E)XK nuclease family protein [Clostridiales bacterium]
MSKLEFTIDDIFGDSLNLKLEKESNVQEPIVNKVDEKPKLIKVMKDGIIILSEELMNKVKKKNLSASTISSFFQCPADWLMDSFILPLIDHEEPIYFVRGHIFHDAMENFFRLSKKNRNRKTLSQITMKVIKDKYKNVLNDKETMMWVKEALQGYIETGFPYKDVTVAQIIKDEHKGPELGVEIFVKGKLGDTTKNVVGFIDRVDQQADGTLQIVDYKSGGKIYPFDPSKEISDSNDFGYWRQQLAYTMLLEQAGHKVSRAILEFPIAKGTVEVDVFNENLRKQVEKDFEAVDSALNKCIENNFFPFNGHFFCKWCGMLSPNFKISKYGNLNVSWADLSQYVEHLQ